MGRIKKYGQYIKESFDKYELFNYVKELLYSVTDEYEESDLFYVSDMKEGKYMLYLNDSSKQVYADDSINFILKLHKNNSYPKLYSNNIDELKHLDIYNDLSTSIEAIKHFFSDDARSLVFYYCNDGVKHVIEVRINSIHDEGDQIKYEDYLYKQGFQVGSIYIALEVGDYIFRCRKPELLTSVFNPSKIEINSQSHDVDILNKNWEKVGKFRMDERSHSRIYPADYEKGHKIPEPFLSLLKEEMRKGGVISGSGIILNSPVKYAHDLFLWFKEKLS